MAFQDIASTTLDFANNRTFITPSIQLRTDRAYLFTVRTTPVDLVTSGLQVLCIPVMTIADRVVEAPLAAKFFPKGFEMYFAVPLPSGGGPNQNGLSLLLLLKRTGRASPSVDTLPVTVALDDDQIQLGEANLPMQS